MAHHLDPTATLTPGSCGNAIGSCSEWCGRGGQGSCVYLQAGAAWTRLSGRRDMRIRCRGRVCAPPSCVPGALKPEGQSSFETPHCGATQHPPSLGRPLPWREGHHGRRGTCPFVVLEPLRVCMVARKTLHLGAPSHRSCGSLLGLGARREHEGTADHTQPVLPSNGTGINTKNTRSVGGGP